MAEFSIIPILPDGVSVEYQARHDCRYRISAGSAQQSAEMDNHNPLHSGIRQTILDNMKKAKEKGHSLFLQSLKECGVLSKEFTNRIIRCTQDYANAGGKGGQSIRENTLDVVCISF